jgi:glycerol uptake facilitator protein
VRGAANTSIKLGMGTTSFDQDSATRGRAIFSEGIGTAVLMFAILEIVDSRGPTELAGPIIGGVVIAIAMVVGLVTGPSCRSGRAFGPALVSALGGWRGALGPADPGLRPPGHGRIGAGCGRARLPR